MYQVHTLEDLHSHIYAGAMTTIEEKQGPKKGLPGNPIAPWERKIKTAIEVLRKHIGQLHHAKAPNPSDRAKRAEAKLVGKYANANNNTLEEILDLLKQKLAAKAKRLRRLKERSQRRQDNKFINNEASLYQKLRNPNIQAEDKFPEKEEVSEYWKSIWSVAKDSIQWRH